MPDYKLFNDKLENALGFKRVTPASIEILCNIQQWGRDCDVYSDKLDDSYMDSYMKYILYMNNVITNFLNCQDKKECIRFANNTLYLSELLYSICQKSLKKDIQRFQDKSAIIIFELSEMPELMEQIKTKISVFLIESGCIDEFFLKSNESDKDKTELIFKYKDIIINHLSELKNSTLICLQELIIKYRQNNIIDLSEENNAALNTIKEIFVDGNLDLYLTEIDKTGATDEDKLLNTFNNAFKIDELSPKDFYNIVEKFISKYKNISFEKCKEKNLLDFYFTVEELKGVWNEKKTATLNYSSIKELEDDISLQLKTREDNYIKSLLILSNDYNFDEKISIIKKFLELGYNNTISSTIKQNEFKDSNIDNVIQIVVSKISSNQTLINQIVAGEHLFRKLGAIEINNELKGDYTFFVASQIKSVERFIKESILKNLSGCNILDDHNGNSYFVDGTKTLDMLNPIQDKVIYTAELGTLNRFLSQCLNPKNLSYFKIKDKIFNNSRINPSYSIFTFTHGLNLDVEHKSHTDFYANFISIIRNGHFHTSVIDSLDKAQFFRKETAFWLLCAINELKGI